MSDKSLNFKTTSTLFVLAACTAMTPLKSLADSGFVKESKTKFNLRYRLETVDQDGIAEDATASTLKARITWQSGSFSKVKLNAELDHVMTLGADDYNDASGESTKTQFPVVADPTGTDLNQLNLMFEKDKLSLIAGRQRIILGNQRFVGGVGWRQNEQTYDGVRAKFKMNRQLELDYSYIATINRIFGPDGPKKDAEGGFQLFNANYKVNDMHKVTGFAYLLDYDGDSDAINTFGVDYNGKFNHIMTHASVAMQSMGDFDATYLALDASMAFGQATVTLGWEQLGSDDGTYAFATPLATAHKFQGFADKFLTTPSDGIDDYYIKVGGKLAKVKLSAAYHMFNSVEGSTDYGSELDFVASYKAHKTTTVVAKFASYSADEHASDTTKFWLMANAVF